MFNRLKEKWQVSAKQFWIIFIAFGCTGITAAYLSKVITGWLGMDADTFWVYRWLVKLSMLLIGYQFLLLFYGALLGQWKFFWSYEKKLLQKLGLIKAQETISSQPLTITTDGKVKDGIIPNIPNNSHIHHIAIFASGAGSNAQKIIHHFTNHPSVKIALIVCNKPEAGVLSIAAASGINTFFIEKERFFRGDGYATELKSKKISFIVLAGFLWKIPATLIEAFPRRIINIHPAMLPKFGGKGMYGSKVHEAVIAAGEPKSGITIHYVDGHYDSGDIIEQATCDILPNDTPETLAVKVHELEYAYYPTVIEQLLIANPC